MKNFFKNEKLANKRKLIFGILASIVLILGLGIIYLNHFTNSGLPQITGTLTLEGLAYQVTVTRDEHGTTHIEAESDKDLFLAQGFIHAQDRLFQMDLARRQASGRLAEVFGEIAINQDRYFRTLLLRYYAEKSLPVHSEETINIINWYVQGINAFIEKAISNNNLPVEFGVLRYTPEPWTVYDTLTLVNLKAYDLAGHWEGQAFRAYLIQNFSEEKALELFPINTSRTSAGPFVLTDEQLQIQGLFSNILDYLPNEFNGSNNWVISGDRTATGFPMLADDPHLSLATPSIWYHNHLKGGNFNVNGVSVAGTPGVVLGHNPYISWGVTNTGPDVQDLFIELRNPENPHQFLFEDEWEEATVLSERIYVDGGEPIDFEIIITRNGPIVSTLANYENRETELSLRWTAHSKTAELDAVLGFNRATNWEEFEEAARDLPSPTQNFVFASNDGTIAFRTIGKVPIRANGRIPDLPA
ncbi:MAG: penicillin acylase family protein, partial [Defluviitaleaceae bacterium]|nr:penicillin acylase family protein [Defluviitaleaceae bacterium]